MYDEKFMRRAIEISAQAIDKPGTRPYGAVIVRDGRVVGEGLNHAPGKFDPTSHGETEAIRNACQNLKTLDLSGCDMYASSEPCSLCVSAMMLSGIGRLYYGASAEQGSRIVPRPAHIPPPAFMRAQVGLAPEKRDMPVEQKLDGEALAVIDAFIKKHGT